MKRAWRWLFGEPARSWSGPGYHYAYFFPGTPPLWRRRKSKPLGDGWREVGFTTDED